MEGPIRVAVCDDARAVKFFLRHVLEEEGDIEVVSTTSTGQEGLNDLPQCRPDVLLLDLVLPAWTAALIVAVVLFAVAGVAAVVGKNKVQEAGPPTPDRAVSGIKKDIATVKGERR